MAHSHWLMPTLVYLAAAVIAVPVSRLLKLGSVIGYLVAGMLIGPWGLKLVSDPKQILEFAEFGVVLMLFLVGLELEPKRLLKNRRSIFGWGAAQYLGSTALLLALALAASSALQAGLGWRIALVGALALAMSSTAIGLSVLQERNAMATTAGEGVLNTALFQDIMAIPVLALIPLLAMAGPGAADGAPFWMHALKAVGVIATIVFGGQLVLPRFFSWIAYSDTPEIFTAAALALVVGIAALMESVGLSMALGAFLAGVLLAESEFRHELEADIEPFKGLLLGLFFIAVGMSIDFAVVMAQPLLILAIVLGFLVVKALVLRSMARRMPIPLLERHLFVILLAQGGEFGFVVLQTATGAAVIDATTGSLLTAAISISMLLTPLLLVGAERFWVPRLEGCVPAQTMQEIAEVQNLPIIIAGFGRYGQIVSRLLYANGIGATILEHDAEQVASLRKWDWRVFYGDATRIDLLRAAGAETARVLVLAIDDVDQSLKVAELAQQHFPNLTVVARARNVQHYHELYHRGVRLIERETFDSALMSGRSVLEQFGYEPHRARSAALRFRRENLRLVLAGVPHHKDIPKLQSIQREGRRELEEQFAQERQARAARQRAMDWAQAPAVAKPAESAQNG